MTFIQCSCISDTERYTMKILIQWITVSGYILNDPHRCIMTHKILRYLTYLSISSGKFFSTACVRVWFKMVRFFKGWMLNRNCKRKDIASKSVYLFLLWFQQDAQTQNGINEINNANNASFTKNSDIYYLY